MNTIKPTMNAFLLGLAVGLAGCSAPAPKQWVKHDASMEDFQVANATCSAYVDENFNPHEDYSHPMFKTSAVEEEHNRRKAYERMFEGCMVERGFRLQSAYN